MSLDSWLHFPPRGSRDRVARWRIDAGHGRDPRPLEHEFRGDRRVRANHPLRRNPRLGPAWIVVLVTSVWMVLSSSEFKFTQLWVLIGLGAFAVAFLVGAVYMSQVGIRLDRAARGEDRQHANLPALLQRWLVGYSVVLVVLLVAVWDMVFKPGT
jgi:Predicted integral membrane protein (DUF2269)